MLLLIDDSYLVGLDMCPEVCVPFLGLFVHPRAVLCEHRSVDHRRGGPQTLDRFPLKLRE